MPMPLSVTAKRQPRAAAPRARGRDRKADAAALGELHRVVDQVFQRAAQPHRVAADAGGQVAGDRDVDVERLGLRRAPRSEPATDCANDRAARTARRRSTSPPRPALAASTTMRGEPGQMLGGAFDRRGPARSRSGRSEACSSSASARMPVSGVRMSWASPASATSVARARARDCAARGFPPSRPCLRLALRP